MVTVVVTVVVMMVTVEIIAAGSQTVQTLVVVSVWHMCLPCPLLSGPIAQTGHVSGCDQQCTITR